MAMYVCRLPGHRRWELWGWLLHARSPKSVCPCVRARACGTGDPQPQARPRAAVSAKKEAKKGELLENPLMNGVQEGAQLFRLPRRCLKKNPGVKRLVKTKAVE